MRTKSMFSLGKMVVFRHFLLFLMAMGWGSVVWAQTDINLSSCDPSPVVLPDQKAGSPVAGIPVINAVHTSGGTISISIQTVDIVSPFVSNICTAPCPNPVNVNGLQISVSGATATVSGTPAMSLAGTTISFTLRAQDGTNPPCERTYTIDIVADGSGEGDPHMSTVSGVRYDFQSVGEFTFLRGRGKDSLEIQVRQTAVSTTSPGLDDYSGLRSCVSVNTAVAALVGSHRISYQPNIDGKPDSSGMQLRIDGELTALDKLPDLGGGASISKSPAGNGIQIVFADGTVLVVTSHWWAHYQVWYLNVDVSGTGATEGLIGAIAPDSWLPKLPDGSSVGPLPRSVSQRHQQLYQTFANAWRVTDQSSLFDYASGTSTETYTNKNWPVLGAESCIFSNQQPQPPIDMETAQALTLDIVDENLRKNAVFDIMITGEKTFADAYRITQQIRQSGTKISIHASRDTIQKGDSIRFAARVMSLFSADQKLFDGNVELWVDGKKWEQIATDEWGRANFSTNKLEAGQHQVMAKFIPSSGNSAFGSESPTINLTILEGQDQETQPWWIWLLIILVIVIVVILVVNKKNPGLKAGNSKR